MKVVRLKEEKVKTSKVGIDQRRICKANNELNNIGMVELRVVFARKH